MAEGGAGGKGVISMTNVQVLSSTFAKVQVQPGDLSKKKVIKEKNISHRSNFYDHGQKTKEQGDGGTFHEGANLLRRGSLILGGEG